jgi:hypothetical protein
LDYPANSYTGYVARGFQNANLPYLNFWDGERGGKKMFVAIRDCNIFLENIHLPPDLPEYERITWMAEVKFLKAYYHFYLMHLYGPIPIVKESMPVSAPPEEVRVYREPIDDVVNYIVELLDEAVKDLPMNTFDTQFVNGGRITKPIALALKAKALVWGASPLFNGTAESAPPFSLVDNRGINLFPETYDVERWKRAAVAIKNAIDTAHLAGHKLYQYTPTGTMSEITRLKYTIRYAVTEKFNPEIIWPDTHLAGDDLQQFSFPKFADDRKGSGGAGMVQSIGATLKIAEQFYTNNGIPIDEDPAWLAWLGGSLDNRYETQVARGTDHQYYIRTGEATAKLNFYREPRFYASLGFDRGIYEGAGRSEANSYCLWGRAQEASGYRDRSTHIVAGYYIKKMVHPSSMQIPNSGPSLQRYTYPLIRLSDLYLLYSEALNEIGGQDAEVYKWIDNVRARAGLKGVVESWAMSLVPDKPLNKLGMREIIKQERLIELAFEGQRFPDIRRWYDAARYMSEPVRGWNYQHEELEEYYQVMTIQQRKYDKKEYLWPLSLNTLSVNKNLVQNPGWK